MFFEDERNAIESRFKLKWEASAYSGVPILYENREFDAQAGNFVSCVIRLSTLSQQITLGNPALHRYYGSILNDVYVKLNNGTKPLKDIADVICEIWRNAQFSKNNSGRILCRTPSLLPLYRRGDYYQVQVQTPYERDVSLITQAAG